MPTRPAAHPSHVLLLLRLAGGVCVMGGLIGGLVWLADLLDRSDGDDLRWGFWHNPFMQFRPFNEPFLDLSMWVLLACSTAVGLGGVILLIPLRWGVPLVTWQARISIVTNSVVAFFIVAIMFCFPTTELEAQALVLRLGSIAVDGVLLIFLTSRTVREFFIQQSHPAGRAFEVVVKGGV